MGTSTIIIICLLLVILAALAWMLLVYIPRQREHAQAQAAGILSEAERAAVVLKQKMLVEV